MNLKKTPFDLHLHRYYSVCHISVQFHCDFCTTRCLMEIEEAEVFCFAFCSFVYASHCMILFIFH